ncbi:MAG: gfo/Idh/MocA family oxidoreductase, partial [Sphaerochaeta sp.]
DIAQPITIATLEGVQTIAVPDPPQHVAQPLIQTIVDQLLGRGTCPSTGESGMRTDFVLDRLIGRV